MKYPIRASKSSDKKYVSHSTSGSRRFGAMLKNAGYDQFVITGRSDKPCYLLISDEGVETCDAGDLWGKDIHETTDILAKRHEGRTGKAGVWTIGPAGENLVKIAQATLDNFNSLGRNVGAVLGSKNLKAVVTIGSKGIKVHDQKRFLKIYKDKLKTILDHPHYQPRPKLHHEMLQQFFDRTATNLKACVGCIGPCRSTHEAKDGNFMGATYQGGNFTMALDFGRRLRIEDYSAMFKLIDITNRYGLCVLTTIRMMYFVTRMYEKGVISAEDTGGLVLKLGDFDAYLALIEKILHRQSVVCS